MVTKKMPQVLIYSTPTCPWCMRTKAFLKEKKVAFKDFDVSSDEPARNQLIEKSGQLGVPVLDIGGKIIVGFDQKAIEAALGL